MHPLTIREICSIIGGKPVGAVNSSAVIDGCVIDSREVRKGDAFFALAGTQNHGIRFAAQALRDGADAVIADEEVSADCRTPHICVPDAEIALAQLAQHNRQSSSALVVGVTGSVGKTTTRGMIASVLETEFTGIQSPRNFNNFLGVPLSLLELQENDEFGVIEIAASAPGEIAALAQVAQPEFAVVTRVAPAHLRGFGSLKTVQQSKAELVASLPSSGTAFLNADDPLVAAMADCCPGSVMTYGLSEAADVRAVNVQVVDDRVQLTVDATTYQLNVAGRHHITSALAAIAIGREVGLTEEQLQFGLQSYRSLPGRCVVQRTGDWTILDDTYNSSPASVSAAVQTLQDFQTCHHRVVALNDMLDLGEQAADLHYGIGASLVSSKIDHIAVTGDFRQDVVDGFLASGGDLNRISVFRSPDQMLEMLPCLLSPGDLLLVKGSRATRMEDFIGKLCTPEEHVVLSRAA